MVVAVRKLGIFRDFKRIHEYVDFNQRERDAWVKHAAASLPAGTKVLDVGAGPCRYRPLFSHCDYHTQDFCQYQGTKEGVLKDEWRYGPIEYVCDVTQISVPDGSFDAVLCTEVLEHAPEPIKAIQEMARVLKPGGKLFVTAPLGSGIHQAPYHYYGGFTPYFYRRFLPKFGLEITEIKPNGGFFKHFLQESARVPGIIQSKRQCWRFNPLRLMLRWGFAGIIPVVFYRLDDVFFVEGFTVGYFVKGEKKF